MLVTERKEPTCMSALLHGARGGGGGVEGDHSLESDMNQLRVESLPSDLESTFGNFEERLGMVDPKSL